MMLRGIILKHLIPAIQAVLSTHANSARDAFNRIGLLIKAAPIGRMLDMSDIMRMLYSTIDVVVHMEKRKIKEIYLTLNIKCSV
jgi:Flp pilus assembly CpaF family ATPase